MSHLCLVSEEKSFATVIGVWQYSKRRKSHLTALTMNRVTLRVRQVYKKLPVKRSSRYRMWIVRKAVQSRTIIARETSVRIEHR